MWRGDLQGPLGDGDGDESRLAEATLDRRLEGIGAAQLGINHNEADRPVHGNGQRHKQDDAREEAGLAKGVGLANDTGAAEIHRQCCCRPAASGFLHDAVGHIHKSADDATPRPC